MKEMKRIYCCLAIAATLVSCKKTLDISKIDFEKPSTAYLEGIKISRLEHQKGSWELIYLDNGEFDKITLKDDGKISNHYYFSTEDELKQISFDDIKLDDFGAKLVEYQNKIVSIDCNFERSKTFVLLKKLKSSLGKPTEIINDTIGFYKNEKEVNFFLKELPKGDFNIFKEVDNNSSLLACPMRYIWIKNNLIYMYTLVRSGDASCGNMFVVISKKAIKDKIVFGHHSPDKDPIFSKYLK
jgi:hypothetical protein